MPRATHVGRDFPCASSRARQVGAAGGRGFLGPPLAQVWRPGPRPEETLRPRSAPEVQGTRAQRLRGQAWEGLS